MSNFLSAYSIQTWLESCPQGYLLDTIYGHEPGAQESEAILANPTLREDAIRGTVQLVVGERAALAASSGLINIAPDPESKRFLATQTLDEARHVEIFTQRLYDLGVKKRDVESIIEQNANPHLVEFASILLEKVDKGDFVAGVVGQNIILEGLAFTVFEMMHAANQSMNPKFAQTLSGTIADERRHVGFGENRIGSLLKAHPDKKPEIERMQRDMSYHMLATFADSFAQNRDAMEEGRRVADSDEPVEWHGTDIAHATPEEMEGVLAETVLGEFKVRLSRLGLEYQTPTGP
jgi:1,2-phenylacetyl-CoA epoxidase catalytic subunit